MLMLVVAASDTHGRNDRLKTLEEKYPYASLYLHGGDWGGDPKDYPKWISVKGNNDIRGSDELPSMRIVEAGEHKILMLHGHQIPSNRRTEGLINLAKQNGCDIVIYGHSHKPSVEVHDGILLVNPGSLSRSRDGKGISFATLELNGPDKSGWISRWTDLDKK